MHLSLYRLREKTVPLNKHVYSTSRHTHKLRHKYWARVLHLASHSAWPFFRVLPRKQYPRLQLTRQQWAPDPQVANRQARQKPASAKPGHLFPNKAKLRIKDRQGQSSIRENREVSGGRTQVT